MTAACLVRWGLAAVLWIAVLAVMEWQRQRAPVRVFGPGGKSVLLPRGAAEALARRGRLQRAPEDVVRQDLGMPPRITADVSSDHTGLAGIDGAGGFSGIDRGIHTPE